MYDHLLYPHEMKAQWIVLIGLVILILFVVIIVFSNGFTPYSPETLTELQMANLYDLPSPWGWPVKTPDGEIVTNPDGSIKWSNETSVRVEGPTGVCKAYTWYAFDRYTPGFPMLNRISPETTEPRTFTPTFVNQTCVDDDQMIIKQNQHMCRGDDIPQLRTSGKCLGNDTTVYEANEIENYWTSCLIEGGIPPRCKGDIGLFVSKFNNDSSGAFVGALCFEASMYTVRRGEITNASITLSQCDMTAVDVENPNDVTEPDDVDPNEEFDRASRGFPSQLFRIVKYNVIQGEYIQSQSGRFLKIVHRPTGGWVVPNNQDNNIYNVIPDTKLTIVMPGQYKVGENQIDPKGAWWYPIADKELSSLREEWEDTSVNPPVTRTVRWVSGSCVLYVPDIKYLPSNFTDSEAIWKLFVPINPSPPNYTNPATIQNFVSDTAPLMMSLVGNEVHAKKVYITAEGWVGTNPSDTSTFGKNDPNIENSMFSFLPSTILPIIRSAPAGFGKI